MRTGTSRSPGTSLAYQIVPSRAPSLSLGSSGKPAISRRRKWQTCVAQVVAAAAFVYCNDERAVTGTRELALDQEIRGQIVDRPARLGSADRRDRRRRGAAVDGAVAAVVDAVTAIDPIAPGLVVECL